eukprot:TRINITY_DN5569_c3_g2_i1.p1 TRINITY_DN5569_c3_g2~~TRINITY_DN5569_c3_g2_i1.p1  ORF type:complete len:397 (+),score=100.88 TRINITY_DN5569_c3_g2_i1:163-1353(+)
MFTGSPMLSLPSKETEKLDLVKPLKTFLSSKFSPDVVFQHEDALEQLQRLREEIRNIKDKNEYNLDSLLKYYAILNSLDKRFPISEDSEIKIKFTWSEAQNKKKKHSSNSLQFEKANVIWQIASLYSSLGEQQPRSTEDGQKRSSHFFQHAAGALSQLKSFLSSNPLPSTSLDFHPTVLESYVNMFLGQAQEVFYEKAQKSQMSPGVLLLLSNQCGEYYLSSFNLITNNTVNSYNNGSSSSNNTNHKEIIKYFTGGVKEMVHCKGYLYKALTHKLDGTVQSSKKLYGIEVSRLLLSTSILSEIHPSISRLSPHPDLFPFLSSHSSSLSSLLSSSELNNDRLYNEPVPKPEDLPKLPFKSMVKLLDIEAQKSKLPSMGQTTLWPHFLSATILPSESG